MNIKPMRGRGHRGGGNGGTARHYGGIPLNRNYVFESVGPDVRLRGTAQQLYEKYSQLGRDSNSAGDRVTAESYFQHAEHYFRILSAMNQAAQQSQQAQPMVPQQNGKRHTSLEAELEQALDSPAAASERPTEEPEVPVAAAPPEE
jgi:hypothetical protein